MREFFLVLLGAICSTVGGIAITLFQAKKAIRKLKRRESRKSQMDDGKVQDEMSTLEGFLDNLAAEMEECLRKELGLKKVCIKTPNLNN